MGKEYSIDQDPEIREAIEAELERFGATAKAELARQQAERDSPSIVPREELEKRRKRRRAADDAPDWPDLGQHGPLKSCANARCGIDALGVVCRYDEFHDRISIECDSIQYLTGANLDTAGHIVRIAMYERWSFDPGKDNIHDALVQIAVTQRFDPMRDYFDGLEWDGKRRLNTWLISYMSAEDTALNRAVGRMMLVAAVRRVRTPGCKYDEIVVLEGPEGTGKSTAVVIMAISPENFCDQSILTARDKEQQELMRGVLLYEIAELSGISRAETGKVKSFASRAYDRARPAYAKSRMDLPRRGILIGTTNDDRYLKSQTGNRRFLPVKTNVIGLDALLRDRDQLWAEAAAVEASGVSLELPRSLWQQAREAQDERLELDPWVDELEDMGGEIVEGEERVFTIDLLSKLGRAGGKATTGDSQRLAAAMRKNGWDGPKQFRVGSRRRRGYARSAR
jgi:predicted P-loop ATPase